MSNTNHELDPAYLYEQFLGFPHEGKKNYYDDFYSFCKENILSRNDDAEEINILSIGTGYGRADLPFIKAFIEKNEPTVSTFNIYCIDPSEFFARKLYENLSTGFENKFTIFSKISNREKDDVYNTFSVEGKGVTGSSIKIRFYKTGLKEFFDHPELNALRFHCVMSFLSMQFVSKIKLLLPKLLARLERKGIIVIGEASKHAAWVSTPPPLIFDEPEKYYCWYKLWSDWHKIQRLTGINRKLRLFPPHDFSLIFKFFEASKSFYNQKITGDNGTSPEFHWEKELPQGIFKKIIKYIENGQFKGTVSSLDLSEFSSGKDVLDLLRDDEFNEKNNLYGAWGEWDKAGANLVFINGLRVHVFSKRKNLSETKYEKHFQQVILDNSFNNLKMSGLLEHSWNEARDSLKRPSILPQISKFIKDHIEIDKGAYIVPICVRPNSEVIASISGSYIPASNSRIEVEEYLEFFKGFDLLEGNTEMGKKRIIPRFWLLLYEISLNLAERQSSTSIELQQALNLNPGFEIIVDMDADSEEIITISKSFISFKLQGTRFKELRQMVWDIINDNEQLKEKFRQLLDPYKPSTVIKQLKSFWSASTVEKLFEENYGLQESFAPLSFFKPSLDDDIIDNLFGKESFDQIKSKLQSLFDGWKKESGIISKLDEIKKSQGFKYDSERIWTILCQLYKYGIYIYEKDLMYIFHISLPRNQRTNVWGAIHLFMHKKEAAYLITKSLELTDLFYKFILPFDNLLYREVHSMQIEAVSEGIGETKQKTIFVHEAKGLIDNILTDRNFEQLSNWGQASAWHMRYLINIWGSISLNTPLSITDGIVYQWAQLENKEFLDKLIFLGIEHAIYRSDMAVKSEELIGKEVKRLINEILREIASPEGQVSDIKNKVGFRVEVENESDIPGWIKRQVFIIMFHHCFWQAVYHALRTYCKEGGQQKEYLKMYFSETHCSIKNRIAGDVPSKIKDESFFEILNEKAENSFRIEKSEIANDYFEIKITFNVKGE